ncbi:MAG: hypothetical protein C5B50_09295 [Verrucomicrobia bacterium]|nr:MAG: hypothetical protein C5B50_09295 [Verrucomicrobiota bacterium]
MNDWSDMRLLQEYAERGVEEAFTILVGRHLGMVYHAALRQARQNALAEDVVQTVFTLLARKAGRISSRALLSGWLYNTTRFVAMRALRDEVRRQRRENEAPPMNVLCEPTQTSDETEQVGPLVDEALAGLSNRDRQIVLARYFDEKSFPEIALATGAGEEATKKRLQRALEKMRGNLRARGVVIGIGALGTAMARLNAQALPAGLSAGAVSSMALKTASGAIAFSALTRGTIEIVRWTKIKTASAAAVAVIGGLGAFTWHEQHRAEAVTAAAQAKEDSADSGSMAALQATADKLKAENDRLSVALKEASAKRSELLAANQASAQAAREFNVVAAKNPGSTNGALTVRDAFASIGKLMRLTALNATNPSPGAARLLREAAEKESLRLVQVAANMLTSGNGEMFDTYRPSSPEEAADLETAMINGILQMSPKQLAQVKEALTTYEREAKREDADHKMALGDPEDLKAALNQIQNLLSVEQIAVVNQTLDDSTMTITNNTTGEASSPSLRDRYPNVRVENIGKPGTKNEGKAQ